MTDVELSGLEVKPYIHSQKNCRPSASGYVMEPIDSILEIDLSSFDLNSKVTIITKRISGNGKVKINNLDYEVLSKDSNHLELKLESEKLSFIRDINSNGKIIIANIIISTNDVKENINPSLLEPKIISKNPENWKTLLVKCGEVKGIKLINDKLLVSEGAYIQKGDLIEYIQTEPAQAFTKSNVIKFIYPCEITAISFNENFIISTSTKNKYKHFSNEQSNVLSENINMSENNLISEKPTGRSSNVLYDSFESGFNNAHFNNQDEVISGQGKNNNGVLIKRNGSFSIPLSVLQPNMQYIVVVEIQKVSGNGKFGIEFTTTDNVSKSSTISIANDKSSELYLKLNTESKPNPGSTYMLKFYRPAESSVGDLLVNKIMIINGITLANFNNPQISKQPINYVDNKFINKKELDPIRALSKFYSREILYNTTPNLNFAGEITLRSKSAINWFNKIKPLFPKIKSSPNSNVVFGELGSLITADKIWLDPFNDKVISNEDRAILSKAKMIFSPSLENIDLLNKEFPSISIQLLEKTWPMIDSVKMNYLPKDYTIMFHRDDSITAKIIEAYSNDYPTLIIIGALKTYEGNVLQLNEYIPYDKILNILLNSKLLIDISINNNYKSGLLSLAFDNGIPVATSNWRGNGNNCKFIVNDKTDELNIPKISDIKNAIEDGLKLNKLNIDINHNEKLNKLLSILFT